MTQLKAPFPYFGGKRSVAGYIWQRLGNVKHYIEPFCGSAAVLLAAPRIASLEVVNDANGFIANFWRAVTNQPGEVARHSDYPVSHVDIVARHIWLMEQRGRLEAELQDANWPGDAKVAGWWLWGQCSWIGSGWCEWEKAKAAGQVPHLGNAGMGIQAAGKVPHLGNAGRDALLTSGGRSAWDWLHKLANRLNRVRVIHGEWSRCLNHNYGKEATGIFFDPPYVAFEKLYGAGASNAQPVAKDVETWAKAHPDLRIVLAGHIGDYDLPGWEIMQWERVGNTYGGDGTKDMEALYCSPGCVPVAGRPVQGGLFP